MRALAVGEHMVVGFCRFADFPNALEIRSGALGGNENSVFLLASHAEPHQLAALPVFVDRQVTPQEVLGFSRAHARVGHNQDEVIGDGAISKILAIARLPYPVTTEGVELAVLLRRKL